MYRIYSRPPDWNWQELSVCSTRCPHRHKLRQQCYLLYIWLPHTVTFNPYLYVEDSWNCTFMSFLLQHRVFYDTVVVFSVESYCRVLLKMYLQQLWKPVKFTFSHSPFCKIFFHSPTINIKVIFPWIFVWICGMYYIWGYKFVNLR